MTARGTAAGAVAAFLGLITLGVGLVPILLIGVGQGSASVIDAYLLRVLWFTLLQAGLSTGLSLLAALPVARALARQAFPGRAAVLKLFALPLALPAIVAVLGIVGVYGRQGWLGSPFDLYGLNGILLAHVFFNLPLASLILMQRLDAVPPESWRLAAQLGFKGPEIFRLIEWPALRGALPGVASLIFLLCAASFVVVLTLGGGPRATTLEVAIYQALRFDYDPARAGILALVQLGLCGVLVMLAGPTVQAGAWPRLRLTMRRYDGRTGADRMADLVVVGGAAVFVAAPIASVVATGLMAPFEGRALLGAGLTSLAIAAAAALLSLTLAWLLAQGAARGGPSLRTRIYGLGALLTLAIPPAVLATGWFVIASALGAAPALAPVLIVAMNALMALPFALRLLAPALADSAARHDLLCASLGLTGIDRFRLVDFPAARAPLKLALGLSLIVSLGDLTAITLFGTQDFTTLPQLIYRQMGSYRLDEAAGTALILTALSAALLGLAGRRSSR